MPHTAGAPYPIEMRAIAPQFSVIAVPPFTENHTFCPQDFSEIEACLYPIILKNIGLLFKTMPLQTHGPLS